MLTLRCTYPLIFGLLLSLAVSAPLGAQRLQKEMIETIGIDQHLGEQLPLDLTFTDETGNQVQLGRYFKDKPVILTLVYYECPMLCTQVLNGLLSSLRMLSFDVGSEFEVVAVSFDPGETHELAAPKKREYVKRYRREGSEKGWHFLTGSQDQIDKLTQAVGFRYEYDQEADEYIHASGIVVLTPEGQLARYFYGIEYSPKDLRLGLVEASNNVIGSAVDQLLLLCYHYDPSVGKYGLVIINTIRVAGAATVLIVGGCIVAMMRRERRRTGSPREPINDSTLTSEV